MSLFPNLKPDPVINKCKDCVYCKNNLHYYKANWYYCLNQRCKTGTVGYRRAKVNSKACNNFIKKDV